MRPQRRNKRQKLFCAFHVRKPSMSGVTFLSLIIPLPPLYVKAAARARGPVPGRSIRALRLVESLTLMARGQVWFIVPLCPRRAPEGSALGVPHRAALDAASEWRRVYLSILFCVPTE